MALFRLLRWKAAQEARYLAESLLMWEMLHDSVKTLYERFKEEYEDSDT